MATEVYPPPPRTPRPDQERSLGELFKKLRDETATLFRQEVQLVKTETAEKARAYGRDSAMLAVGGALAFAGLIVLLMGLGYGVSALLAFAGMSTVNAVWLGPLIVGVVVAIIGYAIIRKGINALKRESPVPERTIRSLQENQEWVKHKFSQQAPRR
jgi:xanthine/uracil permease